MELMVTGGVGQMVGDRMVYKGPQTVVPERFQKWGDHQGLGARSNGFGAHPRTIRDWEPDLMGVGPTQGPSGTGSQI